jgi:flagellar biosynthesis protein FlhA
LLAIGDGLVAQIPSLIISMAAGTVVSRVASEQDLGTQFVTQMLMKSQVLYITAGIIGAMGLIPGMPHLSFLLLAALLTATAYYYAHKPVEAEIKPAKTPAASGSEMEEATWQDLAPIQVLGLEVGYRLISLVDQAQDGELLRRIKGIRKKFAQEIGFLPPAVHIRDNLELRPTGYKISLKGVEIGSGESHPGQFLAINPGMVTDSLAGVQVSDPAFGLPAIWIDAAMRESAQTMGYTVVDASTVIATHLNQLMASHAAELLGRQEMQGLIDHLNKESPKLIEDLVPKILPLSTVQKVLQNLLMEGVHIRDMHSIIESLNECASHTQEANALTAMVRIVLGRAIIQHIAPGNQEVPVMTLDNRLERLLLQALQATGPEGSGIEPGLADTLLTHAAQATRLQEQLGYTPVLLVPASMRAMLARFLRRSLPQLKVISDAEMPESRTIKVTNLVGAIG